MGAWRIGGGGMEDLWYGHGGLLVGAWRIAGGGIEDLW